MKNVLIDLKNPEKVQEFVQIVTGLKGAFDLVSGNYILDGRSLMGIFSLDLSQPVQLRVEQDTPENLEAIQEFIVHEAE